MLAGPIFVTAERNNVGGDRVEVTMLVGSILRPLILWTVPRPWARDTRAGAAIDAAIDAAIARAQR
jgi:hypothetical protein